MTALRERHWGSRAGALLPVAWGCCVGMGIPRVSTLAVVSIIGVVLLQLAREGRFHASFVLRLESLLAFCAVYLVVSVAHDVMSLQEAVTFALYVVGCYLAGRQLGAGRERPSGGLGVLLGLICGAVWVTAAGIYLTTLRAGQLEIEERVAQSVWAPSIEINGPALGAICALGLSLVPLVLFGLVPGGGVLVPLLLLATGAVAGWSTVALQDRTPVVAFAAALVLAALVHLGNGAVSWRRRWGSLLLVLAGAGAAAGWVADAAQDSALYQRFQARGMSSPRYELWATMARSLWDARGGGRVVDLHGEKFVHNMWLDVAYDAGLVALVLLVLFHALHVRAFVRGVLGSRDARLLACMACVGVALVLTAVSEPALHLTENYTSIGAFYCGLVAGRAELRELPALAEL